MNEKIFFRLVHVQKEQKSQRKLDGWVVQKQWSWGGEVMKFVSIIIKFIFIFSKDLLIVEKGGRWTADMSSSWNIRYLSAINQIFTRFFNMNCLIVYYKIPFNLNFDKYFFICIVKRTNQQPTDTQFFDLCTYHIVWHPLRSSDSVRKVYT